MAPETTIRLVGADAEALRSALEDVGLRSVQDAATAVHVALTAPPLADLEDALAVWADIARQAAGRDGDVVTVVGDALLDGDDVAGCALGHGLVAARRAYAMERARAGGTGNVVAAGTDIAAAASAVAWLVRERVPSGDVLRAGARSHGRQRL